MSRSKRKNPIMGHTSCRSEKQDKKLWHKCWRSKQKMALRSPHLLDLEAISPILEREISDVWAMGKMENSILHSIGNITWRNDWQQNTPKISVKKSI